MIGATSNEEVNNGDRPAGSNRVVAQDFVPQNEAIANQAGDMATCSHCDRQFTKRGLGNHIRQKHPVEYNRGIVVDRTKKRWSDESFQRVAKEEANVLQSGENVNMNQHLQSKFPSRSLESIKGKRRSQAYKDQVNSYMASGNTEAEAAAQGRSNSVNESIIECGVDDAMNERTHSWLDRESRRQ